MRGARCIAVDHHAADADDVEDFVLALTRLVRARGDRERQRAGRSRSSVGAHAFERVVEALGLGARERRRAGRDRVARDHADAAAARASGTRSMRLPAGVR